MDLLNLIRQKVIDFEGTTMHEGLKAVVHHIEIAERHFDDGAKYEDYFYTDVIYRTNQAFEGALKEAYRALAESDPSHKTPAQIEKYIEAKNLLKERVLIQFRNYRSEWRNKSTHDYKLFFSSQEALLAIVSVSAFFSILLDEMLEKHAYEKERLEITKKIGAIVSSLGNYQQLDFHQQCLELLAHFSASLKRDDGLKQGINEYELRGKLTAYISALDPQIELQTEVPIRIGSSKMMADLILKKGDTSIVIELKRPSREARISVLRAVNQVASYMAASGITEGIVYIPPLDKSQKVEITNQTIETANEKLNISVVRT